MPRVRQLGRHLGRARARGRGRVRGVDARGRLRARRTSVCARTRRRREVRREREPLPPTVRRGRRELRLSNLDKPFWPDEGITKGDLIAYYRDVAEVLVPHLRGRPFTMKRYPGRLAGQELLPEERAVAHAGLDRARSVPRLDARGRASHHRLRGRQRRARAAVDGEHGLHRPAHVGVASRSPGAAGLGHVRPRSVRGLELRGGRRGRAARQADPRPARARELSEDVRVARDPRARADRASPLVRGGEGVRRDRRGRARSCASRARDDGVGEAEASRRARRREPERAREDERERVLGAPACGCAGVDAAAVGRGRVGARSCGLHDGDRARPGRARRRPLRRRARRQAVAEGRAEVACASCRRRASADGRASRARRCRGGRRARRSSRRRREASA